MRRRLALAAVLLAATSAVASERGLTGAEGHPRERLPLALHVASLGDPALEEVARRVVADWNALARGALGREAFAPVAQDAGAQVTVALAPRDEPKLMGQTEISAGADGVIALPVRVTVFVPEPRGQTSRETLFYDVTAHELGHALGLDHVRDPRSVMCCIHASIDFNDPAVRQAYVQARRRPDLHTVAAQLRAHYDAFWKRH